MVNPNSISATLNGAPATPLTITKAGNVTTVVYHGFPALLAKGATNMLALTVKDTNNNDVSATADFHYADLRDGADGGRGGGR